MQSIPPYFRQKSLWLPGRGRRKEQNLSSYTHKYTYIHIKPTSYEKRGKILLVTVTIWKLCQREHLFLFFLWQSNAIVYFYCSLPLPFLPPSLSSSSLSPPSYLSEFVSQSFCLTPSTLISSYENIHLSISLSVSSPLSVFAFSTSFSVSVFFFFWPFPSANSEFLTLVRQESSESQVWGK